MAVLRTLGVHEQGRRGRRVGVLAPVLMVVVVVEVGMMIVVSEIKVVLGEGRRASEEGTIRT